jgi:hypothetical protein
MRNAITAVLALALLLVFAAPALAASGAPNFGEAIYADGDVWGTKGNQELPPPNDANRRSFDDLYVFSNGAEGQLAVSEAGPRNPAYNGGRWAVVDVTWTNPSEAVLITSADQLDQYDLQFTETGRYFQCPLLPSKS